MTLFAQTTLTPLPDPTHWTSAAWVLAVLLGLAGGVLLVLKIAVAVRELRTPKHQVPQPLLIENAAKFAPLERVERIEQDVHNQLTEMRSYLHDNIHRIGNEQQAILNAIDQLKTATAAEGSRRAKNINERVDKVLDRLSAAEKEAQLTTQRVAQLDQKIDVLLSRSK